ncbi:hypothetical protein ACOMHN_002016 [Nucella lapillus]
MSSAATSTPASVNTFSAFVSTCSAVSPASILTPWMRSYSFLVYCCRRSLSYVSRVSASNSRCSLVVGMAAVCSWAFTDFTTPFMASVTATTTAVANAGINCLMTELQSPPLDDGLVS